MIDVLKPMIKQFMPFAKERMGFESPPRLFLKRDQTNAQNPLGKTAYYDPEQKSVTLYITGRHPKDVMRSLSHELVHHTQNCNGEFEQTKELGDGYAQNDEHLREMEREAYECGNMIFRDWEDNLKSKGGKPLFTSTSQYVPPPTSDVAGVYVREGETKKMKLNESTLRDIIRGVIQEMFNDDLAEGIDSSEDNAAQETARAAEVDAEKARIQPIDEENTEELTEEVEEIEEKQEIEEEKDLDEEKELDESVEELEEEQDTFFPKNESIRTKARLELNEALTKKWAKIIGSNGSR